MKNLSILTLLVVLLVSCAPVLTPALTSVTPSTPLPVVTMTPAIPSTATNTPLPTVTVTSEPIATTTFTATPKPSPTPVPPFEMNDLYPPVDVSSLKYIKDNFGCPTDYGDKTHDGNDFFLKNNSTQVWSTTSGKIVFLEKISPTIGYEIRINAGFVPGITEANQELLVAYVHLTEVESGLSVGSRLMAGDRLGIGGGLDSHIHIEYRAVPKDYTDNVLGEFDVIDYWKQLYPDKIYNDC